MQEERMVADNDNLHHLHVNIDAGELPGISYTKDLIVTFVQRNINRDKKREKQIKQEQCVDDKRIIKRDGFLYLKVKMKQHKMERTPVGLIVTSFATMSDGLVAQWTTRRSTEPKIVGSTPAEVQVKNGKEGQVYVIHVTKGSLSDECLIVGDRILQVDGIIIDDKEMAKKFIVKGLLSGNVTIIVERPDSPTARSFASEVLSVPTPPIANC
uniref:PDZ domain-containing protein n=1 Tax=Onchocerca volvulus TaxID=6282 RepID=A0A8R1Y5I3_ONCVO